jgi:predicted AlkP superfamily phosphohydrolase/phosphomutase
MDDLSFRSAGTVGHRRFFLPENDIGPDDASHDHTGIFILYDPRKKIGKKLDTVNILDFLPTVLETMRIPNPYKEMQGKIVPR